MRIAPNLQFAVIEPTKKSLNDFMQMLKSIYQNFTTAFNGNVGFGDGTLPDNINGNWVNVTAPAGANTDFTVNHNLGRIPIGYWAMLKDRACDVYTGSIASTTTQLTLRATVASAVLRLFIVGLLLSVFVVRSEAQGANHTNIAFKNTTVSGSTGIGGGTVIQAINGAVITVCNGSTLPAAGATCTGTASIFSDIALTQTLANPTNADTNGNYTFYAAAGLPYVVSVGGVGLTTYSYVWSAPTVAAGGTALNATNLVGPGTISGTYTGTYTLAGTPTITAPTITSPIINGTPTGTGIPTITLKKGTGLGNYSSASTSYVAVDATNLANTVTIPTGWKLVVIAQGAIQIQTAVVIIGYGLADGGTLVLEEQSTPGAIALAASFTLIWEINGDGASHTVDLRYKTTNASDSVLINNSSTTFIPTMVFLLTPSN